MSTLLFGVTVAVNYLVGMKNVEVSDKYSLYVTPPNYFFTIWILIFATMAITNIYNLVVNVWSLPAHIYLAINNLLLILWINIFNIGNDPAVFSSFLILVATVIIALKFWI